MKINKINQQPSNPTNRQRYNLLKKALIALGRPEDFDNIIKLMSPPCSVLNYGLPGQYKNKKIGIIGGGLAGMAAAFELRKLGFDITIFEANNKRIGGRVFTYYFDKGKELYGELGPLRVPVAHEVTWKYINLFNLDTTPFIIDNPNAFIYVNNVRARNTDEQIKAKIYPTYNLTRKEKNTPFSQLENYGANFNLNKLTPSIRTEILKILPYYSMQYDGLINMSFRENFQNVGLSPDAIDMIVSTDALSSAQIDASYSEVLQDSYPASYTYLYRINGGNVNLPLSFYKSLTSKNPKEYKNIETNLLGNVTWKGGNWVTGIYQSKDYENVIIKYENKNSNEPLREVFDYVVCTIPFSTLETVEIRPKFSNRKMQAIREINYEDGERTLLLCNKKFWEDNKYYGNIIGGVSNTDIGIGDIVYPSPQENTIEDPNKPGVLVASYNLNLSATYLGNMPEDLKIETVKRQVERVHGLPVGYLDSIVTDYASITWNNTPWARGALASFLPQQQRIFGYDMLQPEYNNRVYFAGEHISTNHGWMQGALYTGMLAAKDIAYNLSKYK